MEAPLLSLAYLTVDGTDATAHLEAAAAGGFDAAGLRLLPPSHLALRSAQANAESEPGECLPATAHCRPGSIAPAGG